MYLPRALATDAVALLALTLDAKIAWANDGVSRLLRRPIASLVGQHVENAGASAVQPLLETWCAEARAGLAREWSADLRLADDGVRAITVRIELLLLEGPTGEPAFLFGTLADVSATRATDQAFQSQTRILEMIAGGEEIGEILQVLCESVEARIPGARCSILLLDAAGLHLVCAATSSLPAAYNEAIDGAEIGPAAGSCGTAAYLKEEVIVVDVRIDPRWSMFRELAAEHGIRSSWSVPILSSGRLGRPGDVLGTFGIYFSECRAPRPEERLVTGRTAALAAIALERDRAEAEMRSTSLTDPLTGLANRASFLHQTANALARASRHRASVAVLFVDIDHFKVVNDSLGHDAGDQVLRELAALARAVLRPGDTIARFGGDEFTLLCEGIASAAEVEAIGARLQAALREPLLIEGRELFLSASIGIALGSMTSDAEKLIGDADAAMYRAKAEGRATVVRFDELMRAESRTRLRIHTALQHAISRDEFTVFYQPVVDLASGRPVGVEALLRWTSAELGQIEPSEFISVAEDSEMITVLGTWVLTQACLQAANWQQVLSWAPTVSVNVSPRQFARPDFFETVLKALRTAGLDPRLLRIEVTETTLGDPARTGQLANRLDQLGVTLSIDDFGTGYSSLARVRSFPVHEIKIDRSFVSGLGVHDDDETVVAAITGMARALGIRTVAEGIETELQLRRARELGCTHGQGFFLCRPAPEDVITSHLLAAEGPPLSR